MKVSQLQEGMLLTIATTKEFPVIRNKEPDRMFFFPDIFAGRPTKIFAGPPFGLGTSWDITALNRHCHYMYLGRVKITLGSDRGMQSHHELMDDNGSVYKIHGRWFKNFVPSWKQEDVESC